MARDWAAASTPIQPGRRRAQAPCARQLLEEEAGFRKTELENLIKPWPPRAHPERGSPKNVLCARATTFTLGDAGANVFSAAVASTVCAPGGERGYSLLMTPLARIIMMITITIVVISGFQARAAGGGDRKAGGGRRDLRSAWGWGWEK